MEVIRQKQIEENQKLIEAGLNDYSRVEPQPLDVVYELDVIVAETGERVILREDDANSPHLPSVAEIETLAVGTSPCGRLLVSWDDIQWYCGMINTAKKFKMHKKN